MPKKKRKTLTKYQRLLKAKKSYCSGRITKAAFNKVANAYVKDTVKKGNKTKSQAKAVVSKVSRAACANKAKSKKRKKRRSTRKKR